MTNAPELRLIDRADSPFSTLVQLPEDTGYTFSVVTADKDDSAHPRYLCHDKNGTLLYQATSLKDTDQVKIIEFNPDLPLGNLCKIYHHGDLKEHGPLLTGEITDVGVNEGIRYGKWTEYIKDTIQTGSYNEEGKRHGFWLEIKPSDTAELTERNVWKYADGKEIAQIGFKNKIKTPAIERLKPKGLDSMLFIGRFFDKDGKLETEERSVGGANDGIRIDPQYRTVHSFFSLHPSYQEKTGQHTKTYYQNGEKISQAAYWWHKNKSLLSELEIGTFVGNLFKENTNESLFLSHDIRQAYALAYGVSA